MGEIAEDGNIYKMILEGINEAVVTLDTDGIITSFNPSGQRILGLGPTDIGKRFNELNLMDKDTNDRLVRLFKDRLTRKNRIAKEFRATFKDGTSKWLVLDSILLTGEDGEITGLAAVIDDITERKRYEQALVDSESRFRTVVESLHEGLGITDEEENIIYANDSLSDLLGYPRKKLIGMNLSRFVPENDFKMIVSKSEKRRMGSSEVYESRIVRKNGEEKDVLISAAPWTSEDGKYLGSIGLLLDISERKITEKALKENEEKYRATVEQSAENIYIYDIETSKILESNPTLQELLGYSAEEMKDLTPADFIDHTKRNISSQIHKVMEEGKAIIGERTYVKKNGERVEVEVSASHIRYGDRSTLCVVSRDITERKRTREQLIEERNRAEFYLDLLAHDIGNLHHGILTGMDMVHLSEGNPERRERAFNLVRDLLLRSIKLVDNVMTFSSLRSMPLDERPIDLGDLLEKGLTSAISALPNKTVNHDIEWDGGPIEVLAEPLLQEAFFNIYHNGIKYQKGDGPKIRTIVKRMNGSKARIIISDFGPGIPDDRKDSIFDRMKDPLKREHTGLGMAIIKVLVERYGGDINITNRVEGDYKMGTNFVIDIPIK